MNYFKHFKSPLFWNNHLATFKRIPSRSSISSLILQYGFASADTLLSCPGHPCMVSPAAVWRVESAAVAS